MENTKLEKTSPGVYLMPKEEGEAMPCLPKDLHLEVNELIFRKDRRKWLAGLIVRFSRARNEWCGVRWSDLIKALRKELGIAKYMTSAHVDGWVELYIQQMCEAGLIRIHGHMSLWRFVTGQCTGGQVVFPTAALVHLMQEKHCWAS